MKALKLLFSFIAFFALMCWAGSVDYAEQVIYNMNETTYKQIVSRLGEQCSQREIVKEYMNNKLLYDTMNE